MLNKDEIIRMAREAGLQHIPIDLDYPVIGKAIERFAALVAAHEREACAKESLEVLDNLRKETIAQCQQGMIEAYKLGQSEEREACAKVVEAGVFGHGECAAAIRARGENNAS